MRHSKSNYTIFDYNITRKSLLEYLIVLYPYLLDHVPLPRPRGHVSSPMKKYHVYNKDESKAEEDEFQTNEFKRELRNDAGSVIRASLRKRKMKRTESRDNGIIGINGDHPGYSNGRTMCEIRGREMCEKRGREMCGMWERN